MSEYEPIDLQVDTSHLLNQLMEVGQLASTLVSRAAVEAIDAKGGFDYRYREAPAQDAIVEMYDKVAQRITACVLELQIAKGELSLA